MRANRDPDIAAGIARSGLYVFGIGYGECAVPGCDCEPSRTPWCYTVGRVESGEPELVVIGLPWQIASGLANAVHEASQRRPRRPVRRVGSCRVRLDPLPGEWLATDLDRLASWFRYYGPEPGESVRCPDVAQVVWAPKAGFFPDDPRCDRFSVARQPLLKDDPFSYPEILE